MSVRNRGAGHVMARVHFTPRCFLPLSVRVPRALLTTVPVCYPLFVGAWVQAVNSQRASLAEAGLLANSSDVILNVGEPDGSEAPAAAPKGGALDGLANLVRLVQYVGSPVCCTHTSAPHLAPCGLQQLLSFVLRLCAIHGVCTAHQQLPCVCACARACVIRRQNRCKRLTRNNLHILRGYFVFLHVFILYLLVFAGNAVAPPPPDAPPPEMHR